MDAQTLNPVNGAPPAQTTGTTARAPGASDPVSSTTNLAQEGQLSRDSRTLQFQVDKDTREVVTTIVDSSNKTVVVQIPSEEVLRIAQAIDRMQGFFLKDKA